MPILLQKNITGPVLDIQTILDQRLAEGNASSFLHIVPTNRKVRDAERKYLRALPRQTGERFFLFTLETLAVELHNLIAQPRRFIDGPSQAVLLSRAIKNRAPDLRYFKPQRGTRVLQSGTFQKIINVINKLKNEGVYPSLLAIELDTADGGERAKLHDLLTIYEEYERLLGSMYVDTAGFLKIVNEQWDETAGKAVRMHFPNVDLIVISGFDRFSDPELTMIANLTALGGFGTIISFDYFRGNDAVFGHLEINYRKFLEIGFALAEKETFRGSTFSFHCARYLFAEDRKSPGLDLRDRVVLYDAPTRKGEVELIAKIIKRIHQENPETVLSKICVAMFKPDLYTSLFHEVFREYGIPANITDRFSLDQSPCITALLSLLAVRENNFRLRDVMRALTTPFFSFGEGDHRIDAGNLYGIGTGLRVSAGYSTWTKRIERRLAEIKQILATTDDEVEAWRMGAEREGLGKAARDLEGLSSLLEPFRETMRPADFRDRVLALLGHLHVAENILAASHRALEDEQREKDARGLQKFLYFIDEYLDLLESETDNQTLQPLSYYLDTLRTAIPQILYNIRQKWGYGVQVTTLEETRGLEFDVMIIAGLVDGEFPPAYQPEILFSQARREHAERLHPVEHRYLFYQVATNFKKRLFLTTPRRDANRELVASTYIDALASVARFEDLRGSTPSELSEPLFSRQEMYRHAGEILSVRGSELPDAIREEMVRDPEAAGTIGHMREAIEVENSRERNVGLPEYRGILSGKLSPEASRALKSLRERVYSVTQLESYGRCPFQFFADKVLRLSFREEPEEGISGAERGGIIHEILFEFYTERRSKGLPSLGGCDDADFSSAMADMRRIAAAKLDRFVADEAFWKVEKDLILGSDQRKGILNEFLEFERSREYNLRPSYFEVAFGSKVGSRKMTDPKMNLADPVRVGNVQLSGKVDRVDVGTGTLKIIDYKTGATTLRKDEIESGMSLQLPIYLYVIEKILAEQTGDKFSPAAAAHFKLRSPFKEEVIIGNEEYRGAAFETRSRSNILVPTDEKLREVIAEAIAFVNDYVDKISEGVFPVEPKDIDRVCVYCEFKTVCRIQNKPTAEESPTPV